jgi:hypothetical protein
VRGGRGGDDWRGTKGEGRDGTPGDGVLFTVFCTAWIYITLSTPPHARRPPPPPSQIIGTPRKERGEA